MFFKIYYLEWNKQSFIIFTGTVKGEIHLNGRPVDKELMLKMCGFVPQRDLAIETLTVREHLNFMVVLLFIYKNFREKKQNNLSS